MSLDPRTAQSALVLMTSLLCAPLAANAFTLQETGEWVVSCDNTEACSLVNASQLTQFRVAQPSPFGMSRVCIHRKAGPHALPQVVITLRTIASRNPGIPRAARHLRIVGAEAPASGIALQYRGAEHWEVPRIHTEQVLADLKEDRQLHVMGADGAIIERLPLDGIDRALATIDKAQGRAATVTALREKGSRPASVVPAERRPEPIVTAPLSELKPTPAPSAAALALRHATCGSPGLDATTGFRLLGDRSRPDRNLWVTSCSSREGLRRTYFVIENADGSAAPAAFPGVSPSRPTGAEGLLSQPEFDPDTGRVRELWREAAQPPPGKACAIQRLWGWTGAAFELAEERRSLSCAGIVTGHWPTTYTRGLITPATMSLAPAASSYRPPC